MQAKIDTGLLPGPRLKVMPKPKRADASESSSNGSRTSARWNLAPLLLLPLAFASSAEAATCPALAASRNATSVSVSSPGCFEIAFDTAHAGGVSLFYDLAEDPTKTLDLAGGPGGVGSRGLFHFAIEQPASTWYQSSQNLDGPKLELLEATAARVRVRQESFYQQVGLPDILPGVKGTGDYSIYPAGRLALRWNRRTTDVVAYNSQPIEMTVRRTSTGPLSTWQAYRETGNSFPGSSDDDFILTKLDQPGARTDFLTILYKDWITANGFLAQADLINWSNGGLPNEELLGYYEFNASSLPANSSETWNFLTYFKPTSFIDHNDPAVVERRDDYRGPEALAPSPGTGWDETGDGDFFNESEAAYTLNFDPAAGLTFDLNGAATRRHEPFLKIRRWRSLADPFTITVEGITKTNDADYVAEVKPVSRAYFAQNARWYSTFENPAAVTAPDVGGAGAVNGGTSFVATNRHGNGALFDNLPAAGENVTFPSAGNFDLTRGAIALWYQPSYPHTDGVRHVLWHNRGDNSHFFLLEKTAANELRFSVRNGNGPGNITTVTVTSGNYSWRAKDWVHLRAHWDAAQPAGLQLQLLVNGTEPTHADSGTYSTAGMLVGTNYIGSDSTGADSASGIIDELGSHDQVSRLAHGGLIGHAEEYLADPSPGRDFDLTFSPVTPQQQGQYLYLASDSKFLGLNVDLATAGVGLPVLQWQYWNGAGWQNLTGVTDETNGLTRTGTLYWSSEPAGWSLYSDGLLDLYYVRAFLASGSYSTTPVASVIKTDILLFQYGSDVTADSQTFAFGPPPPTAVELASFEAAGGDGEVVLSWETASEIDNLGFHLYRSGMEAGPYERITSKLIAGLGSSPMGGSYSYRDTALANGTTYFYRLEDVETSGRTKLHGPVSATPSAGGDPERTPSRRAYGNPGANRLDLRREGSAVVLELVTEGFYATPREDGTAEIEIPGFVAPVEPGSLSIPVRRAWVEALAGRKVVLESVEEEELRIFPGLRPSRSDSFEAIGSADGVLSARRTRTGASQPGGGASDLDRYRAARILATAFQQDVKKALVEIAPLRWHGAGDHLRLARRVAVRLVFEGRERSEISLGGRRGRARRAGGRRTHSAREVVARLATVERGLHGVSHEAILSGSRHSISTDSLRLSRGGEPVAFHTEPDRERFGPGSRLYFVSPGASANPYGKEAVYEIEWNREGLRMEVQPAAPAGKPVDLYRHRLELESNRLYQAALLDAPDPWLWEVLLAPVAKSFPFSTSQLASRSGSARLEVFLQGASDLPADPDHHVRLSLNGVLLAEHAWNGKQARRLTAEIPSGVLREGANELSVENLGDTGAAYSMVMVDRFSVEHPRKTVAENGRLEGLFRESGAATLSGMQAGAFLLDVTDPDRPRWLDGAREAPAGVSFAAVSGRRYLAWARDSVLSPELRKPSPGSLPDGSRQVDYLVIGPRAFLEAAEPLLALRREQGLATAAVAREDIDAAIGHGEHRPEAIREFLAQMYHQGSPGPRYVVLLGDATLDFKDHLRTGVENRLAPLMIRTSYLWTASDPGMAAVNGDDSIPDLAIGRLPAASIEEARVLIEKIVAYERGGSDPSAPLVLVADDPDEAGDFAADAEAIAARVLGGERVERIYLGELGAAGAREAIRDAFGRGVSVMTYIGHGGIPLWASENLLGVGDVPSLALQPRQPIVLVMSCLNGYFHFPYFNSLGEELVKAEGKGAIASFAPSGLSLQAPARIYLEKILEEIVNRRHERLGDAILAAQSAYAATGQHEELLAIYHLLGDPALRLR